MSQPALLTLNTGSSSIKFRLFLLKDGLPYLLGGKITDIGNRPQFAVHREAVATESAIEPKEERLALSPDTDHQRAMAFLIDWLGRHQHNWHLAAACHRVVHGGTHFMGPVALNDSVMKELKALSPLAPLHQPHNLHAAELLWELQPDLVQYGCFDTAFHAGHDRLRSHFALPQQLRDQGIRRYGFHGLSYQWITHRLQHDHPELATKRIVAAHLGNGASLCAMVNGKSIDTSLGMTAIDGLPMGTRCGNLDVGAVIYMLRELGLTVDETEMLLYKESGLKGLSGITNNVERLEALMETHPNARFALDYFAWRTAQHVAALVVSLGGLDGLVFTGGIGENSAFMREEICRQLSFLAPFTTLVIPADEERGMALSIRDTFYKEAM